MNVVYLVKGASRLAVSENLNSVRWYWRGLFSALTSREHSSTHKLWDILIKSLELA
jgi:hypothetical protein